MVRISQCLSSAIRHGLVLTGCWILSAVADAQSNEELDRLIFDPVIPGNDSSARVTGHLITGAPLPQSVLSEQAGASAFRAEQLPDLPSSETEDIEAYLAGIAELERREGQFAPELVQNLQDLGSLYQAQDEHGQAIATFERADHISRVNNGLYHPGQIPIIEELIESYLAVEDFSAANDKHHYLLFLNRKLLENGDIAGAPSFAELGDRNMETFGLAMMKSNDNSGSIYLFGKPGMDASDVPEIARFYALNSLVRARNTYSAAISTIIDNRNFQHPRLLELEYKYLETLFLPGYAGEFINNPHYYLTSARRTANMPNRWKHLRRNKEGYEAGINILERIQLYIENDAATTDMERIAVRLELGDWHLMYHWTETAREEYAQAWTLAQALGMDAQTTENLFNPAYPVQLPLFTAKPNSREKFAVSRESALAYDGYIDVSFSVSRNGTARRINVLDKSGNTTYAVEERLKRYLRNSPFRPAIVDSIPVNRDEVRLRYYFTYFRG